MTYDHLMTNEEAIEELKNVSTIDMPIRLCEAYYMSLKALEQEPKTIPISVIDDIKADIYALIDDTDSIYGTSALHKALDIIDKHISGKAESEEV